MFARKIESVISAHLKSGSNKMLLVEGSRRVGKTHSISHVGYGLFGNFFIVSLLEDSQDKRLFADIQSLDELYLRLSFYLGGRLSRVKTALVFFDDVHVYPNLLPLLNELAHDGKYKYIASSSVLGLASPDFEYISTLQMYPMDFEEFLNASGFLRDSVSFLRCKFESNASPRDYSHRVIMQFFKQYLIVGGMPEVFSAYISRLDVQAARDMQNQLLQLYKEHIAEYSTKRSKSGLIYSLIPELMKRKMKRVVAQDIEGKKGKRFSDYRDDIEFLKHLGAAFGVQAVSSPLLPLEERSDKCLLKLYLNDVGLLSALLFGDNIQPIIRDENSAALGSLYETAVAAELAAHGHDLYYYYNRNSGGVDFLIGDHNGESAVPIVIKSGKDYLSHSALPTLTGNAEYNIRNAYVFTTSKDVKVKGNIIYAPVYYAMFL